MKTNSKFLILFLLIALLVLNANLTNATEKDILNPEIVANLEVVTSAAISLEGNKIAFIRRVQRSPEDERGNPYTELFVVSANGGTPLQFTHRPHPVSDIQWSPDGLYIYFRSNRPEIHPGFQVYRISVTGGEAELVTREDSPVLSYKISPESKKIAYIVRDPEPDLVRERKQHGDDWVVADEYFQHRRLYVMDLSTRKSDVVTSFDKSIWEFEWSPDGKQIAVQASPLPTTDHSYMFLKMYIVEVTGTEEPSLLIDTEGKLGRMAWSPDGKYIAWHGAVDITDPIEGTIFATEVGSGTMWTVTPDFEGTVTWVDWINYSTIVFISEEKTWTRMSTIPLHGGTRTILFDKNKPEFTTAQLSGNRRSFVAHASAYNHPNEVYVGDIRRSELKRITYHNPALRDMQFNNYEYVEYKARDGLLITGLLLKPLNYEEGKKYPLICQIHGGPEAAYTQGWNTTYSTMTQLYSHLGYMVFLPNYRASTGRGVEFAKANHRDMGGKEFTDVVDGVEFLAAQGLIDRNRVGIIGGSYGGYFANLAATRYAGKFAAAVSFVGVSNTFSDIGTKDVPFEKALVHFNAWHFQDDDKMLYIEPSPVWYLERAVQPENKTPLLIVHCERDRRVPVTQAEELYTGLKLAYKQLRGMTLDEIPVTYIMYPRAGHGTWEIRQQLHFSNTTLEFFEKHLKDDGIAGR